MPLLRTIAFALIAFLAPISLLFAQVQIPAGTTIPVMLSSTINADRAKPGEQINARVMQNVPLEGGERIARRSRLVGTVVDVKPTSVTLRFDSLLLGKQRVPLTTSLRAIASMTAVQEAQIPTNASGDRGTSSSQWNTVQIGGNEVVYGRPGNVLHGDQRVGHSAGDGSIFAALNANPRNQCESTSQPQAVWIFGSSACGAYGFADLDVARFGTTAPQGDIVLTSSTRVLVRGGSALLLRVIGNTASQ